ncbi:MAG TPA: hypothetical protein DEF12_02540 [Rhodobacteraceae bacterium]|nr:hypothetical protein [Paracoccaceae bacterium]HBV53894.1 hypothetical protein [Paracoccaceae bacterium]
MNRNWSPPLPRLKHSVSSKGPAAAITALWSVDIVHDQFAKSRRFRIFNLIEDFMKECLATLADTLISGHRIARELTALIARPDHSRPRHRVHLERNTGLERRDRRALAHHRTGQADAKGYLRGLQIQDAKRVF